MSIVVSYAPGPEGDAAISAAKRCVDELGGPLLVIAIWGGTEKPRVIPGLPSVLDDVTVVDVEAGEDAVEVILDRIDEVSAQLLVLGLRKRSTTGKLILGTSVQRLLLDAPCPVVTVKPA